MITHSLRTSTRGYGSNCTEVTVVTTFSGEGATEAGMVETAFTAPLKDAADALARTAADSIEQTRRDRETAVREALNAVLEQVDPSQHAAITQRFGVSL